MDNTATRTPDAGQSADQGLVAELRESLLLLGLSVALTAAVTVSAQAVLSLLG